MGWVECAAGAVELGGAAFGDEDCPAIDVYDGDTPRLSGEGLGRVGTAVGEGKKGSHLLSTSTMG